MTTNTDKTGYVGLALMVKNEAEVLERCIGSARPVIGAWVVQDTGSSDGTPELARRLLGDLPGFLADEPWQNYAANRSKLLELARDSALARYWLLLDADEVVQWWAEPALPALTADAYSLEMTYGPLRYWVPRLVSGAVPWSYRGYAHEYLFCEGAGVEHLDDLKLAHFADGGNHADKLERELGLLLAEEADHPGSARTAFYIARTFEDMGQGAAAQAWYERRKAMGGYDEEVWYCWYRLGVLALQTGQRDRGIAELLDAVQVRPGRAEPLHHLANYFAAERSFTLANVFAELAGRLPYPLDSLFVDSTAYRGVSAEASP